MQYYSKIKSLCKERKLSLKELAEILEITPHGLNYMFNNDSMQIRILIKISEHFKVPITYFFTDSDKLSNTEFDIDRVFETMKQIVKERIK